jgi:hypothetical protein
MELIKHLRDDRTAFHSFGEDILKAVDGVGASGRDNQFNLYDKQVRRYLAVVENVILNPLKKDALVKDNCSEILAQHKKIRQELTGLSRSGKAGHEWTEDFRDFMAALEQLCTRHGLVASHAERISGDLGEQYEHAKLSRMRRTGSWAGVAQRLTPSNVTVTGAAAAVAGVAAAAGAAYATNLFFKSDRRLNGGRGRRKELERGLDIDETARLISSAKVEDTPVVDRNRVRIGAVTNFMVDKYTGHVAYAVMRFGGTMGFGASLFPLPWSALDYDEQAGGYRIEISKNELAKAPRFEISSEPEFDADYRRAILDFYRPLISDRRAPAAFTAQGWDIPAEGQVAGAADSSSFIASAKKSKRQALRTARSAYIPAK